MNIIITGGAGFIGSHLCEFLLAKGNRVICIDNLITGSLLNIEPFKDNPKFTFINQDVTRFISIDGNVDWVLHFASLASPVDYLKHPIQTLKVGGLGTHNTLGLALAKKARFLLASTSEVYGDPLVNPQKEDYWGNVNCIGPRGVYDESKRFAEAITMAYHRYHGVDTRIVRIFNTYGERMRVDDGRVVPNFICQALRGEPLTVYGDGEQTRSFCYISDLLDGMWRLMQIEYHEPLNLGNPDEITIFEFAELVHSILRINGVVGNRCEIVFKPLPVNDPKVRRPDITRARELLGWQPEVNLRDGLQRTIGYFRRNMADR
ncbi:MAG: UDP-glucuronic acid decarboxylase family protein [candidate division WOR-3 bacterium]|nr:UDP-glucuronic acid decarboxylase family protein [candidate division WOR-3 bacterium]